MGSEEVVHENHQITVSSPTLEPSMAMVVRVPFSYQGTLLEHKERACADYTHPLWHTMLERGSQARVSLILRCLLGIMYSAIWKALHSLHLRGDLLHRYQWQLENVQKANHDRPRDQLSAFDEMFNMFPMLSRLKAHLDKLRAAYKRLDTRLPRPLTPGETASRCAEGGDGALLYRF